MACKGDATGFTAHGGACIPKHCAICVHWLGCAGHAILEQAGHLLFVLSFSSTFQFLHRKLHPCTPFFLFLAMIKEAVASTGEPIEWFQGKQRCQVPGCQVSWVGEEPGRGQRATDDAATPLLRRDSSLAATVCVRHNGRWGGGKKQLQVRGPVVNEQTLPTTRPRVVSKYVPSCSSLHSSTSPCAAQDSELGPQGSQQTRAFGLQGALLPQC